jgi:hypothetical protein
MGGKARPKPNAGASGIRTRHISPIEHRRTPLLDAIFSGLLTPADAPLIDAEKLFRQPGPLLTVVKKTLPFSGSGAQQSDKSNALRCFYPKPTQLSSLSPNCAVVLVAYAKCQI